MANNYLITGYWGEPHVTAENDRGINAAIFGAGRFVLPVGERFRAEYIGNNTIRIYDGKLVDNGACAGIPAGEYVDLLITNAGQGMHRNDLIVFQYSQDAYTLIESGTFVVVQGDETRVSATDPVLTQEDLLSNRATKDQMALWRVSVYGATISAPEQLFTLYQPYVGDHDHSAADITSGTLGLSRGGTGATTAAAARAKLGAASTATYTATVSTSWTEDTINGGYYQTVTVNGMLDSDNPIADVVLGDDVDANALYLEAWACVTRITTSANAIKIYANEDAPTTAFTVQLKVVR
jgi:hypothetical protein